MVNLFSAVGSLSENNFLILLLGLGLEESSILLLKSRSREETKITCWSLLLENAVSCASAKFPPCLTYL